MAAKYLALIIDEEPENSSKLLNQHPRLFPGVVDKLQQYSLLY